MHDKKKPTEEQLKNEARKSAEFWRDAYVGFCRNRGYVPGPDTRLPWEAK